MRNFRGIKWYLNLTEERIKIGDIMRKIYILFLPLILLMFGCDATTSYRYKEPGNDAIKEFYTFLWDGRSKDLAEDHNIDPPAMARIMRLAGYKHKAWAKKNMDKKPVLVETFLRAEGKESARLFFVLKDAKGKKFLIVSGVWDEPVGNIPIKDGIDLEHEKNAMKKLKKIFPDENDPIVKKLFKIK
ncbi:hypothetical protein ACFL35_01795 [Candidatus Riflebacteria bacterium]